MKMGWSTTGDLALRPAPRAALPRRATSGAGRAERGLRACRSPSPAAADPKRVVTGDAAAVAGQDHSTQGGVRDNNRGVVGKLHVRAGPRLLLNELGVLALGLREDAGHDARVSLSASHHHLSLQQLQGALNDQVHEQALVPGLVVQPLAQLVPRLVVDPLNYFLTLSDHAQAGPVHSRRLVDSHLSGDLLLLALELVAQLLLAVLNDLYFLGLEILISLRPNSIGLGLRLIQNEGGHGLHLLVGLDLRQSHG
eukprot:CAMPEP_0204273862 /NCGR_PEP_ID=MMETSP0468-20130131/24510_1 /ASSEMBLY_ACC=CAM_ASM_000383 /TAXON_ID=2969 /ORGANISM="Oxyrrhis marina" /LENGTH=252 /DNA_ID=CAMNT_0051249985 /DNA_START=26 /DNA_END=785 /DNA_ORIENTATION=+